MIVHNLVFLIYTAFYIVLPGWIVLDVFNISLKDSSLCNKILLSYFSGFGILIFEYFFCSLFGTFTAFAIIIPSITVLYLVINAIRKRLSFKLNNIDMKQILSWLFFVAVCFAISFLYMTFRYGNLLSKPYVNLTQDFYNHVGLTATLSKGLPASDLKVSGITLFYHYFQDLMFGMCENIFHISAFDLITDCTPAMVGITVGTALFCFLKREKKGKYTFSDIIVSFLCCLFFLVFGGAWGLPLVGANDQSGLWNWNNYHIFTSVNASAFALAAIIAVLIFINSSGVYGAYQVISHRTFFLRFF